MAKTLPSDAGSVGSIPGRGAKIPCALPPKNKNLKQKRYCNKYTEDFKNGLHQKKKKNLWNIGHKTNLNKFQRRDIMESIFSDCSGLELEVDKRKDN